MTNKKAETLEYMPFFHPLQTYTKKDLEAFFHTGRDSIEHWIDCGLIQGIKAGKCRVFTYEEILKFQELMLGRDIQNKVECVRVAEELKALKKAA